MILWSLKYFSSCECQWYAGHFNLKWLSPLNSSNPCFCSHWATSLLPPLPPFPPFCSHGAAPPAPLPPFSNKLLNLISFKANVNIATFLLKQRESQPQWNEALGCQCGWQQPWNEALGFQCGWQQPWNEALGFQCGWQQPWNEALGCQCGWRQPWNEALGC